jgi:ribosomal protein L40E
MTDRKPVQLEFTDCRGCGKRVATTATLCRHCNTARLPTRTTPNDDEENDLEDSHAALSSGGYDGYDEDVLEDAESEKSRKMNRLWWYVAWILLLFFALGSLFPFLI